MVKKFKNIPLLCLALANLALSVKNGFNWLSVTALILSLVVLIWDVLEAIQDGKRKKH